MSLKTVICISPSVFKKCSVIWNFSEWVNEKSRCLLFGELVRVLTCVGGGNGWNDYHLILSYSRRNGSIKICNNRSKDDFFYYCYLHIHLLLFYHNPYLISIVRGYFHTSDKLEVALYLRSLSMVLFSFRFPPYHRIKLQKCKAEDWRRKLRLEYGDWRATGEAFFVVRQPWGLKAILKSGRS